MKRIAFNADHVTVFFASLLVILLELFLTRILNLKAWNHVVYTVIPFAILGYGIGANAYLIFKDRINRFQKKNVVGYNLFLIAIFSLVTVISLIYLPLRIEYVVNIFTNVKAVGMLLLAYTIFMLPFMTIGFLIVYLFTNDSESSPRLYFYDLLGAGVGAALFFPFIHHLAVLRSLLFFALISLWLALYHLFPKNRMKASLFVVVLILSSLKFIPEIQNYTIDKAKGWEWISGYFPKDHYEQVTSRWHPLGRTDIYRITDEQSRNHLYVGSPGTFLINVEPRPEFAYISTNFLAGTPAYHLSQEAINKNAIRMKLFSQSMEAPYLLLDEPKVVVIGAGGGRDLFMAKTHGALEVTGAEINPGIVREMSPGGVLHEYSGKVYTLENTQVYAMDGRTLVKQFPAQSVDLIVLNGVDTFSGLSSGAYAYAESYLYTKNALMDYLRILDDSGMINFNRWLFTGMPRETLRLHAIALEALQSIGADKPWDHIIIGDGGGWSFILIKKTPFTNDERKTIFDYFRKTGTRPVYPQGDFIGYKGHPLNNFDYYAEDFQKGLTRVWKQEYPFDISVITDDNPFFYKYYKLSEFKPFQPVALHHTGTVIFLTQMLIFIQAVIFILLFIFLPLFVFKKNDIKKLPPKSIVSFVVFFGCLGCGFMFIEIPMMQRFVLLLGSPIYSITVVLAVLLISTGVGSLMLSSLQKMFSSNRTLLTAATFFMAVYVLILISLGTSIYDHFAGYSFGMRAILVGLILFPLGFSLGVFFPSGLVLMGRVSADTIPWAWAINGGFSVLGSILSIILAQFLGFNTILMIAIIVYGIGLLAFFRLEHIKTLS